MTTTAKSTPFTIEAAPSPNHSDREGTPVSLVVLHYTGMESGPVALERLRDPEAGVSSHYFVEEDGRVFSLVPEELRAHHAGLGYWDGIHDVNSASIGIEIVNPGHYLGYRPFPEAQIESVLALVKDVAARHGIGPLGVIGHSDLAPDRKDDPGELFPWARFADDGLALPQWSGEGALAPPPPDYDTALAMLGEIGYGVRASHPIAPVLAFQRRFAPQLLATGISPQTRQAIQWVHGEVMRHKLG